MGVVTLNPIVWNVPTTADSDTWDFRDLACRSDRWEHEEVLEEVQRFLDEKPEAMRIRRETVEHPFGKIKARGRDELSDEATAQREDRDVACRAGLQSDPRHKHSWDRDADRSNPGHLAPDQTRSRSKDRLDRSYALMDADLCKTQRRNQLATPAWA